MLIYLLRHGQTAYNAQKRYQGQRDIPLSPAGAAQLCHGVIRHHGDARRLTQCLHRLGEPGIGVAGQIDPAHPAGSHSPANLLQAHHFFLGRQCFHARCSLH